MTEITLGVCGNIGLHEQGRGTLRGYQQEAVDAMMAQKWDRDHVHVVSLPTGAGKTFVLLTFIARLLADNPMVRFLILAPNWSLLKQLFDELGAMCPDLADQTSRIGGRRKYLGNLREATGGSRIYLTTLHTWHNRQVVGDLPFGLSEGELVVINDESHWAMEAQFGESLRRAYLGKSLMIGLSATPNVRSGGDYKVAYHKTYAQLCPGYLARPFVREVCTGLEWEPTFANGAITPGSLRHLGLQASRNQLVVNECVTGLRDGRYSRIVVFACNIDHANRLRHELRQQNIAADVYHSQQLGARNQDSLRDFRSGTVAVLVTVQMATMGLNVPEIDAVFLVRPTESQILLAQMIGRGSRKLLHKHSFWIVEFTDCVRRMASQIFHARDYVGGAAVIAPGVRTYRPVTRHHEPPDSTPFERLQLPGLPALTFLAYQTFGVEIELTSPGDVPSYGSPMWVSLAYKIIACLQSAAAAPVHPNPVGYHGYQDPTKWYVSFDSSAGWEIVSPILASVSGFEELMRVCEAVHGLVANCTELCVSHRTGLHVTLATQLDTPGRWQRLAALTTRLEPALFTLVAPSRLYGFDGHHYVRQTLNRYCKPLRQALGLCAPSDLAATIRNVDRYHSVNFTKIQTQHRLLEVRLHNGTVDYRKIVPWICLWMHIINRSRFDCSAGVEVGRPFRSGNRRVTQPFADREDIVKRLAEEGIALNPEFLQVLRDRRTQLQRYWARVLPQRVAGWERAGWYDRHGVAVALPSADVVNNLNIDAMLQQTV